MDSRIFNIVSAKLRAALEEIGASADVTPMTAVYGRESPLDSTQLVSFVVDIEEELHENLGVEISLVNEQAFSQSRSPFRDVAVLCHHIETLIGESKNAS